MYIISQTNNLFYTKDKYSLDEIIICYKELQTQEISVFSYMATQIIRLKRLGKERTSKTYQSTLNSFRKFRQDVDMSFRDLNTDKIERYEVYLINRNISRNSSSFYMRILSAVYYLAVEEGLCEQKDPFKRVFTGVERAISLSNIKLKDLDLLGQSKAH